MRREEIRLTSENNPKFCGLFIEKFGGFIFKSTSRDQIKRPLFYEKLSTSEKD